MRLAPYWTAWLATLTFFAGFYALLVPLPRYLIEAGLPDWQIGLILGAFGVASLIGRPLAGVATDRFGSRRVMLVGAAALAVGAFAVPTTTSLVPLFALRILQAAGYVAFTTAGTALVVTLVDPAERGSRLAIFGAAANLAVTLTPALIAALLELAPLVAGLMASGVLAVFGGLLATQLPAARGASSPAPASAGNVASSGVGDPLIAADAASAPAREREGLAPRNRAGEAVQADAQGAVWPAGKTARTPIYPRRLWLPMTTAMLLGAAFAAFFLFAPILAERRAVSPGLLYTVYGLSIIATRLVGGRFLDKYDVGRVVALAAILTALGHALIASDTATVVAPVLIAAGGGLFHPALIAHHAGLLPEAPGRASAAFYVAFDLGIGAGSWLFGVALELAGVPGLYWSAAVLALAVLPLTPALGTRGPR